MGIAILFENYGPYHVARLRGAAKLLTVRGIEQRSASVDYSWNRHGLSEGLEISTLASGGVAQAGDDRAQLLNTLKLYPLEAVALPGWSGTFALTALRWCLEQRVPAILMCESQAIDEARSVWKEFLKRQIVGCFSSALVGGRPHADYMAQLRMQADRICFGYDAVDNGYFQTNVAKLKVETLKAEARQKHGLPAKYFLASARFIEKKNLPRLLEAYAFYRTNAEKLKTETLKSEVWDLALLGDGAMRKELEARSLELGVSEWVHMPGFKQYPELPTYYGCASAFIHASTTEQWGLVVNEAMASGLPVLVSNRCGCAPDLVQEGVNGFTFDPYDVDEMAKAMLRISQMEDGEFKCMGAASQRIVADWGPERFASGLKAAVDKALEVGPIKPTMLQRLILKALLMR